MRSKLKSKPNFFYLVFLTPLMSVFAGCGDSGSPSGPTAAQPTAKQLSKEKDGGWQKGAKGK